MTRNSWLPPEGEAAAESARDLAKADQQAAQSSLGPSDR